MRKGKFLIHVLILLVLTLIIFCANLFFGSVNLSFADIRDPDLSVIFYDIRLPKSFTALFAGAALALCGALMQNLFRNPLAGPYVLGVSSGASLFVAIAVIFVNVSGFSSNYFVGKSLISLSSIAGAMLVTFLILVVSQKTKSNITVLLVGIMLSQILGALQNLVEFLGSAENLKTFIVWGMGSVSNTTMNDIYIIAPICTLLFILTLFYSRSLNAILLNDSYAQNLGINVYALRITVIVITATLIGVITAFCGPIAFVGLSVPIACRLIFKTSHQLHQMVYCLFMGAIVLLFCDTICQLLSNSFALPVNTVTTIVGSPVVIYLLFKSKSAV